MTVNLPSSINMRPHYIDSVIPFMGKNILKVFTGQRRVGKSYILFQLITYIQQQQANATILYINKEDLAFSFIKNEIG